MCSKKISVLKALHKKLDTVTDAGLERVKKKLADTLRSFTKTVKPLDDELIDRMN